MAAIGDCSSKVWIEPPPRAELEHDYMWEAVSAFPELNGAPEAWDSVQRESSDNGHAHGSSVITTDGGASMTS